MTSNSPDPSRPPSPPTRAPSPPPQTHSAPHAPRLIPSAVLGPHPPLPSSTALVRHQGSILPARPPDFVAAAIRTPAHFEALTKGLRDYDFHVEMSKFATQAGMHYQPSAGRASVATILNTISRGSPGRVTVFHASPTNMGSEDRREGGNEVKEDEQKIQVIDSTEEDEEEKTLVVKKKKKKSKKKAKGKKAELDPGTVAMPQQEDVPAVAEGTASVGTTMMERTTMQLIAAEEGGQEGLEVMSDNETIKEISRPTSADDMKENVVSAELPSHSQTLIVETAPRPYLIPPHLRGATTPASLLLTDLHNSDAITVNLPSARTVSSPAAMITLPIVLEEMADEDLKVVAEVTGSTTSPDVMTPAMLGDGTVPNINISTPRLDRSAASPTPTETDDDVKTPGELGKGNSLQTTDRTPRLAPLGFGVTDVITPLGTILPKTQSTADEITSEDQLIQLTTFSPRDDITSSPVTDEPLSVLAEAAIISQAAATPPAAPYLSPQLPSDIPSPLAGPHQRFFSPPPASPLRQHILPGTPESLHPTTNAWSLFYSSNASVDARVNPGRTSAKAYNENLIHLFTTAELAELFGLWKALRRQIALATGRTIEAEGEEMVQGQMGLGLQYMKDDGNFHFFVKGVKPMWEDPMCAKGGKIMFATHKDQMDSLFFDVVLLLISDRLSLLCAPPPGSGSFVVGACISRRPAVTRLEIWLGGPQAPSREWTKMVQDVFVKELGEEKVYEYKPFASGSGRRTGTGELAAAGRGMTGPERSPIPMPMTMSPIPLPAGLGRGMAMQPGNAIVSGWAMNVPMGRGAPMGRSMSTGIITAGGRAPR